MGSSMKASQLASSIHLCLRCPSRSLLRIKLSRRRAVSDSPCGGQARTLGSLSTGMRTQLHAGRQLAARPPVAARSKHRNGLRQRSSYTAVAPPSVTSLRRTVRVDDRELFRRTRRVLHLSRNNDDHTPNSLVSQGWKWHRQKKGFELYTRQSPMLSMSGSPIGSQPFTSLVDNEVLAVGKMSCSISQLAPLRSSSESDYNSVMRSLYGSDFIYGSLVHKAIFRRRSRTNSTEQGVQPKDRSSQLLVKTCAFVHTSLFDKKNEQMCYAELFSPTSSGGFNISTCSLAGREVITGKVRAPLRRALYQLHPFSACLSAEPASSGVHVVFRARFHRSESDGSCSSKVMNARLWKLAKGMCKLGKLVDNRASQGRRLSSSCVNAGAPRSGPRNSRCTVCTKTLYSIIMPRSCCRCELCAYNVCAACCSKQHVTIYNRHVAPLLVCARCHESLVRDEFDNQLRAVNPASTST